MKQARLVIDPAFGVGDIDPRIRGSFVEHLGRCVYGGVYEPQHPNADADGFRTDVLELTRDLGVSTVRYPGGNFVSGYRWEDGIGPREARPTRLDLAWRTLEPNWVGVDEFMAWCRKAQVEPMMAVNLGTRGIEDAAALVEYCNHSQGSYWSDLRASHGATTPHDVKLWCLGNEMDGPWQIGHKTARDYGLLAAATGHAMRLVDPDLELVACGSSNRRMATFASWEAEVLEHTYDVADYISLHSYYRPHGDDMDALVDFVTSGADMDAMISEVVATCDYVRAKLGRTKRIDLSFDEWNVWYTSRTWRAEIEPWRVAPPILQDKYNVMDAVVVGSMLNSLFRHADRVRIAAFAQLVNVIAPMTTQEGGPIWRQTTFHPMQLTFQHGRGTALRIQPDSPLIETNAWGEVPQLDSVATIDPDTGEVALFAINRSLDESLELDVELRALRDARPIEHVRLHDTDRYAINTQDEPDRVMPRQMPTPTVADGHLRAELPPLSWHMLRFATSPG